MTQTKLLYTAKVPQQVTVCGHTNGPYIPWATS